MKKEFWVEILVGGIILAGLGFVSTQIVSMSNTLGSMDAKVSSTADRVNRIAQALPDVGVRIAHEELTRFIRTAVLSTVPIRRPDGTWNIWVTVLDNDSSKKWSWPVQLASRDDKQAIYALLGAGADDRTFILLSRLQEYSRRTGSHESLPPYLNANASFVLGNTNAEEIILRAQKVLRDADKSPVDWQAKDYAALLRVLREKEVIFKPKPEPRSESPQSEPPS